MDEQVAPRFAKTPGLIIIPSSHRHHAQNCYMRSACHALYHKYNIQPCLHFGLFWAGGPLVTRSHYRVKKMVLVFEMDSTEIREKWRLVDSELRELIADQFKEWHGVCLRYYEKPKRSLNFVGPTTDAPLTNVFLEHLERAGATVTEAE